jgi:hypothetical protein
LNGRPGADQHLNCEDRSAGPVHSSGWLSRCFRGVWIVASEVTRLSQANLSDVVQFLKPFLDDRRWHRLLMELLCVKHRHDLVVKLQERVLFVP